MTQKVFPPLLRIEHQPNRAAETAFIGEIGNLTMIDHSKSSGRIGDLGSAIAKSAMSLADPLEQQFANLGAKASGCFAAPWRPP